MCLIHYKAKHSPEKYLRLPLGNILQTRRAHKKNGTEGHRMISSAHTMRSGRQTLVRKKKYGVELAVFQSSPFFLLPISLLSVLFEPCFYTPNFNLIEVPSLKYNLTISNCRLTVSFELMSLIIICSVFWSFIQMFA